MKQYALLGLLLLAGCAANETQTPSHPGVPDVGATVPGTAKLSGLSLSLAGWQARVGDSQQARAQLLWSNGSVTDASGQVRWSVAQGGVITIDPNTGLMKALQPGKTTVTATATLLPTVSSNFQVVVTEVETTPTGSILSVNVQSPKTSLYVGETVTAQAQVTTQGPVTQAVTWTSDNSSVLRVDSLGRVTAISAGQAKVTATATADVTRKGQLIFTVQAIPTAPAPTPPPPTPPAPTPPAPTPPAPTPPAPTPPAPTPPAPTPPAPTPPAPTPPAPTPPAPTPQVDKVTVTPTTLSLDLGAEQTLKATVAVSGGASEAVEWSSSNASVASVGSDGKVRALAAGQTTITVTSALDKTKSASASVTVLPSFRIAPQNLTLSRGMPGKMSATGASGNVVWSSSDAALVRIKNDGSFVTGTRAGTAVITATGSDGRKVSSSIVVKNRWLTGSQIWRAISDTCVLSMGLVPNTAVEIQASLTGECPASVPVQVVRADSSLVTKGSATPSAPYTFLFSPKKDDKVYIQVFRNGTINGEPAATYFWSGTDFD